MRLAWGRARLNTLFQPSRMLTAAEMAGISAPTFEYHPDAFSLSCPALDVGPERKPQPTAPYGIPGQPASTAQADTDAPRPALDWNKPASTDRFPGFEVTSGTSTASTGPLHALQRIAAERSPLHGSAWLVVG